LQYHKKGAAMSKIARVERASGAGVCVEPVRDRRALREFVTFPFTLYRGDSCWVPPLIEERLAFFDPRKNPFFDHARYRLFLARQNGALVGTIGAVVDDRYNDFHNERMGAFGFCETIDNQTVADALLDAAESWIDAEGMQIVRGPLNFSTNQEVGLLIDGFDEPPVVMMTYNPRYYQRLIEVAGYHKAIDLYAYDGSLDDRWRNAPPKVFHAAEVAVQREGVRIRPVNMRRFADEIELAKQVYNRAWERNWGFVPMTDREIDHLAAGLRPVLDPALLFIAETQAGEPIGVSITLPDLHQALRWSGGGHMFPFGLAKFLWHKRRIDQVRMFILGVVEEYRGRGIDAAFYVETARAALAHGYKRIEGSWVLETNVMMNRIIKRLGGRRYKTYRIYEKMLKG
jgi:GNAT superfamily N-acetyltransferase